MANIGLISAFQVRHFMLSGRVCLGIFSSCPLPKGAEITIPFEFQYEEYHSNLDCACAQDMCAVMKYNLKFQNENHDSHTQKRFKAHDEDSNSEPHQKMSPLRVSLGNSQSLQVRKIVFYLMMVIEKCMESSILVTDICLGWTCDGLASYPGE